MGLKERKQRRKGKKKSMGEKVRMDRKEEKRGKKRKEERGRIKGNEIIKWIANKGKKKK